MSTYGWSIFVWALATITLVRFVLAPYWMWQEDAKKLAEFKKQEVSADGLSLQRDVKALLGKRLTDGKVLMRKAHVENTVMIQDWTTRTRNLIEEAFDLGKAALFLDSSGYTFYGDNSRRSKNKNWLDGRLRRLADLIQRVEHLQISQDFDPKNWEA